MDHKTENENLIKEFELLICDFFKGEKKDDIFYELTASLQLYLSLEYLKVLIEKEDLFKVDEYISYFITFVYFIILTLYIKYNNIILYNIKYIKYSKRKKRNIN